MTQGWTPPSEIDEFRVDRRLGRGGMGDVWLARDTLLERDVALKFASEIATDEARLRFRVEARAVARLHHPNIVALHHSGELGDRPFLVTELLRGESLDRVKRLAPARVVAVGADLARGLAAAHTAGVIHRDVKPANAFLCEDGTAKLLDFGIAQLQDQPAIPSPPGTPDTPQEWATAGAFDSTSAATRGLGAIGTPTYMAPETWRGEPATRKTDVYSLGALLFTLLADRPPFRAESIQELVKAVLAGRIPNLAAAAPEAPAALVDLVLSCMSLDPDARPSAEDVCNTLQTMLAPSDSESADADRNLADPDGSPYRGLLSFGAEHRGLFFGREAETAKVLTELRGAPVVLVVGPSGAGKSSLVSAGVVPQVLAGALGEGWHAAKMVPGLRPLERLSQALALILDAPEEEIAARIADSPAWAAEEVAQRGGRVLVVVDQLEEAWTLSAARERGVLFEALAAFARMGPTVRVVATLRADFLPKLKDLGELRQQVLRAPVVLGALSPEGLRRAIVEPARRRGVEVEPALVERLVEAAHGSSGMLPLLEFALNVLWTRRDHSAKRLALTDLDALGGLEGALSAHADAALAGLSPALRVEARRLLLALVTVEHTRARREEQDLLGDSPEARRALDALLDARLVVASAGEETTAYEVAHEVLLSGWPALRAWLDEESSARRVLDHTRRAATEWMRLSRGEEALFGERQLDDLDALGERVLSPEISEFVAVSRATVRRARLRRQALAFALPVLLASLGATAWSVSHVRRRAAVARALDAARALDVSAEETARAADAARADALALFDKDDLGPAERQWKKMLALEEDADRRRRDVGAALDQALAFDPGDRGARSLSADITLARLLAAERLHKDALLRELRAQLDVYDDGSRAAKLRAPAHVRVVSEPPDATLTLARYREDSAGTLVEADGAPFVAGGTRELEPGSYVIVAEAPGRYTTRDPFVVRRGEERALRIVLPRAADVPDGMVYVPSGRALYGSSDDEATRGFFTHQPAHDVEVPAFLIARTEVTTGDYLAFLRALPEAERKTGIAAGLVVPDEGEAGLKVRGKPLAWGEPYCNGVEPCADWTRLPIEGVSREDGELFTEWLSRSGRLPGARLCTDREWERAARGADDRRYPSGNGDLGPTEACTLATYGGDMRRAGPCAAGTHPASRSPFGVDDMAGSAWEWTSGSPDIAEPKQGAIRGAGWSDLGMYLSIPNRGLLSGRARARAYGLRVCADPR